MFHLLSRTCFLNVIIIGINEYHFCSKPVEFQKFRENDILPELFVLIDDFVMELFGRPDSEVAGLPVHHVEHPLHLVVIVVAPVQPQLPSGQHLQTEILINLRQAFKSSILALERTLDLHYPVLLHQTVGDADEPPVDSGHHLLTLCHSQAEDVL